VARLSDDGVVPTPLIIDCDPGIDDMMALLVACASTEVELLGLGTVAGNVNVDTATTNALSVLALAGRPDVPVAQGCARPLVRSRRHLDRPAHAADGLGGARFPAPQAKRAREHAVEMLARVTAPPARPVTLVAVGPLTNVAVFYALHPQLAARLDRLVVMGGAIGTGNITPAAEFNIWSDPEAAYRVLTSTGLPRAVPTTMVGLDVTLRTVLTAQDHERIRRAGPIGQLAAAALDGYAHGVRGAGVPVHDAVAVVEAIRPGLVVTEPAIVEVDCGPGPSVGNTLVTRPTESGAGANGVDEAGGEAAQEPGCRVAVDIDAGGVVGFVLDRVTSLDAP
jgi:pyrimidine-specific ribonucleoside hydrolase